MTEKFWYNSYNHLISTFSGLSFFFWSVLQLFLGNVFYFIIFFPFVITNRESFCDQQKIPRSSEPFVCVAVGNLRITLQWSSCPRNALSVLWCLFRSYKSPLHVLSAEFIDHNRAQIKRWTETISSIWATSRNVPRWNPIMSFINLSAAEWRRIKRSWCLICIQIVILSRIQSYVGIQRFVCMSEMQSLKD